MAARRGSEASLRRRLLANPTSNPIYQSIGYRRVADASVIEFFGSYSLVGTINRRVAAKIEGDFAVFLIGARINRWWTIPVHLWFARMMPKMLAELESKSSSETGVLGYQHGATINVQYGCSVDELIAYAGDADSEHFPCWVKFEEKIGSMLRDRVRPLPAASRSATVMTHRSLRMGGCAASASR